MADEDDLLTEEERAALEEPDTIEENPEQGAEYGEEAAAAQEEAAQAAAQAAEPEPDPEPQPQQMPPVSQFDEQLQSFEQQKVAAFDEYEDGELDRDQYLEKLGEIEKQQSELTQQRAIAAMQEEQDEKAWTGAVSGHFKDYPELQSNQQFLEAFDQAVREVTGSAAYASKSYAEQLQIAHARTAFEAGAMGLEGFPALKGQEPHPTPPQAQPARQEQGALGKVPPTLAKVPAADLNSENDGEFAALNRLVESGADPEEVEAALAKLTPEQRDRFSSAA